MHLVEMTYGQNLLPDRLQCQQDTRPKSERACADLTEEQWQSIDAVLKAGVGPHASNKALLQV